jgi:molybdate transport system substrate-binding protein
MKFPHWLGAAALSISVAMPALADELLVLSAAAVKTSVTPVPALFAGTGADTVQFQFGTAGAMRDKAIQGELFDIVIVPPAAMDELVKRNLVDPASRRPLGTVRLAAAVAAGTRPPELNDVAALRQALLQASSVGIADPARGATTGIYLSKLFVSLGLGEEMKTRLRVYPEGQNAMEAVAAHEIDMAMGQFSEASMVAGLAPRVALPEAAQLKTTYVAALGLHAPHPVAAQRLLDLLGSARVQQSFTANGFDVQAR